jgi:tartrate dehydratase alpha subunit/fumarate hydratase class I-like protein
MGFLRASILELIIQTSTHLPPDIREAMRKALRQEKPSSQAEQALNIIAEKMATIFRVQA